MPRIAVIGIGNPDRGDDAFGRVVAARLRGRLPEHMHLIEQDGEATALLDQLGDADAAILVDAAVSGGEPGQIRRFDVACEPLPAVKFGLSTHGFGLTEAIELARILGKLPSRCIVYAVEARSFELGAALSPELVRAVDDVVARVIAEVDEWSPANA
jgi:hydrogenase maturation protease